MRSERWGIALGVMGLGATLLTAALAYGDVKMSDYLLWAMGASGALLMLVGVVMLLPRLSALRASGREQGASSSDVDKSQRPLSSLPRGYIDLPEDQADWAQRQLLKRALGDLYQRGLFWQHDEENFGRWEGRAHELIKDALGEDEARLFLTAEKGYEEGPSTTPFEARAGSRISRLATVMMRVDSLKPLNLRPGFDGKDWVSRR